jgi:hypothetical protein
MMMRATTTDQREEESMNDIEEEMEAISSRTRLTIAHAEVEAIVNARARLSMDYPDGLFRATSACCLIRSDGEVLRSAIVWGKRSLELEIVLRDGTGREVSCLPLRVFLNLLSWGHVVGVAMGDEGSVQHA